MWQSSLDGTHDGRGPDLLDDAGWGHKPRLFGVNDIIKISSSSYGYKYSWPGSRAFGVSVGRDWFLHRVEAKKKNMAVINMYRADDENSIQSWVKMQWTAMIDTPWNFSANIIADILLFYVLSAAVCHFFSENVHIRRENRSFCKQSPVFPPFFFTLVRKRWNCFCRGDINNIFFSW